MIRRILISLCFILLFMVGAYAVPVSQVDTTAVADTVAADSTKLRDKGFDVRKYLNSTRSKAAPHTEFKSKGFFNNTFIGVRANVFKLMTSDYGFGPLAGGVIGKWVHPAVGVRLSAGAGYWYDNFEARKVRNLDLSASVLFNLMSYVGGYNTARFCELSVVGGVGLNHVWKPASERGTAISGHVGLNVNMRIFDRIHLFIEPRADIFFNPRQESSKRGIAISSAGSWSSYVLGFNNAIGLTYNFGQTKPETSRMSGSWKDSKLDWNGYFSSVMGGVQFQNSVAVWRQNMTAGERVGMHYALGFGRWFNNYFALRLSSSYSRNAWIKYLGSDPLYSQYVTLHLEGMFDVVSFARTMIAKSKDLPTPGRGVFGLSLVAGPELGRIMKQDKARKISDHYVGVSCGVQAIFHVHKWVSVFAEPHMKFVPYSAPNADINAPSDYSNYYDGLFNFNIGLEVRLPAYHKPSTKK